MEPLICIYKLVSGCKRRWRLIVRMAARWANNLTLAQPAPRSHRLQFPFHDDGRGSFFCED